VASPNLRLMQYQRAVAHYSSQLPRSDYKIAMVENSGAGADLFADVAANFGHRLIFIKSSQGNSPDKGVGEALMLDAAVFALCATLGSEIDIVKVTGRLRVSNLPRVLRNSAEPFFAAQVRRDLTMVDSRLLQFQPTVWAQKFSGLAADVNESKGRWLEHALVPRLATMQFEGVGRWLPFASVPFFCGTAGSGGARYDTLRSRLVHPMKVIDLHLPHPDFY
jgi:hypothetical protein